jgi:hypothetical protein|tara:strand:+ start:49 stop:228 length:180 start_codon:yes stop_codon:yes gene_type:complete
MTTFRIFTTEFNGLVDTTTVTTNLSLEDAKADYLANRHIQSIKGFKRPMPLKVTIQTGY